MKSIDKSKLKDKHNNNNKKDDNPVVSEFKDNTDS